MTEFERELLQLIRGLERRLEYIERQVGEQPLEMSDSVEEQLSPPWIIYYANGEVCHGTTDAGDWVTVGISGFNDFVWGVGHQVDEQNHLLSAAVETRSLVGDETWLQVVDGGGNTTKVEHIGPDEPGTYYDVSNGAYFDGLGHFVTPAGPPE